MKTLYAIGLMIFSTPALAWETDFERTSREFRQQLQYEQMLERQQRQQMQQLELMLERQRELDRQYRLEQNVQRQLRDFGRSSGWY